MGAQNPSYPGVHIKIAGKWMLISPIVGIFPREWRSPKRINGLSPITSLCKTTHSWGETDNINHSLVRGTVIYHDLRVSLSLVRSQFFLSFWACYTHSKESAGFHHCSDQNVITSGWRKPWLSSSAVIQHPNCMVPMECGLKQLQTCFFLFGNVESSGERIARLAEWRDRRTLTGWWYTYPSEKY